MKSNSAFFFLPLLLLLQNCANSPAVSNYNYSYLYDEKPAVPRPEFQLFHLSDSVSQLFFKLNSDNILYSRTQDDSLFKAQLQIKYQIFDWNKRNILVDSMTVPAMNIGINNNSKLLIGKIDLRVDTGKKYFLEVKIRDSNRDLTVLNYAMIDKRSNGNRQYFLITSPKGKVVFGNVLQNEQQYSIHKSALLDYSVMKVKYTQVEFPLPPPPFAEEGPISLQLDMNKSYLLKFDSNTVFFTPSSSSAHHFFPVEQEEKGFYLFHFHEGFPFITNTQQMIAPLRYISSNEEFAELENASIKKKTVDEYWIQLAGSKESARQLMEIFYDRVEKSNRFFTSYREGWKTDRGIIYIIYGVPTTIYKTPTFESWIYGEETNVLSLHFKFRKVENEMSNNVYQLIRDVAMKPSWYRAVDTWRQGRIVK